MARLFVIIYEKRAKPRRSYNSLIHVVIYRPGVANNEFLGFSNGSHVYQSHGNRSVVSIMFRKLLGIYFLMVLSNVKKTNLK